MTYGPRRSALKEDLALNAWMWMNATWAVSDLGGLPPLRPIALAIGGLGAVLLANAVRPWKARRGTLDRLRKLRAAGR